VLKQVAAYRGSGFVPVRNEVYEVFVFEKVIDGVKTSSLRVECRQ
jgi:hypothetical protein